MHRCVCIWQYILQNYNYKLHFQNLSIYHISHVSIGTLAAENLDVCIACDLCNIQLTMGKDRRWQNYSTNDLMPRLLINLFIFMYSSFISWPPFRSQNTLFHAHTLSFATFLGNFTKIQVLNSSSQHENLDCACTHAHSSVSHLTFICSLAGIKVPNPKSKYKTLIRASTCVV